MVVLVLAQFHCGAAHEGWLQHPVLTAPALPHSDTPAAGFWFNTQTWALQQSSSTGLPLPYWEEHITSCNTFYQLCILHITYAHIPPPCSWLEEEYVQVAADVHSFRPTTPLINRWPPEQTWKGCAHLLCMFSRHQ